MDRGSGLVPRRRRHAGEIFADTSGLILPYVTLMLVVIVGLALLAVDGSRALGLSTSLQKGADAVAIAMAAELDGRPDAITRANRARDELVNNSQTFAEGPAEMLFTIRFLRELPPDDADAIPQSFDVAFDPGGTLEEQSVAARFVEVTVEPRTLNTVLPASFIGTFDNTLTTSAQAVAGFTQAVCRFTPMFMCNPYEGTGVDIFDVLEDEDMKRQQLKLRMVGPSSGYVPDNFGFLVDNEGQTGANALRRALATSNPSFCFAQTGVDTEPGQSTGPVRQGLNVRFDIYDGPMSGNQYRGKTSGRDTTATIATLLIQVIGRMTRFRKSRWIHAMRREPARGQADSTATVSATGTGRSSSIGNVCMETPPYRMTGPTRTSRRAIRYIAMRSRTTSWLPRANRTRASRTLRRCATTGHRSPRLSIGGCFTSPS
jgi:hypothetical protein